MNKIKVFAKCVVTFVIGFSVGGWGIYNFVYSSNGFLDTFFNFSIADIFDLIVEAMIGYLVYNYTKKDSKEDKINSKRIELIEKINRLVECKLNKITTLSKDDFKISIQEIQNISKALFDLCRNSKYEEKATYIDDNLSSLEKYISEEMEDMQMSQLFDSEARKVKIESFIKNVTSKCNETIVCIYKE